MKTLAQKIEQIDGLTDTSDLSEWENSFVLSIVDRYEAANKDTRGFSGKQVEVIERIWTKHFA